MQLMCHVAKGDMPIQIKWLFNGRDLQGSVLGVVTQKLGDRSSFLTVPSVNAENNGSYTCMSLNAAGNYNHTAHLFVKGREIIFNYDLLMDSVLFLHPFRPLISPSPTCSIFVRRRGIEFWGQSSDSVHGHEG